MNQKLWVTQLNESERSASLLGGKGLNLFNLADLSRTVPEFGVVTTVAFDYYKAHQQKLPEHLLSEILSDVSSWDTKYVAVRSSMTAEDGAQQSYAGMMETFLYVEPQDIEALMIRCFQSMESERVAAYEKSHKISAKPQKAAIVIQKMVDSQISGVAFSRAPMGDSAQIHVEAGLGLGEGVVSGLVEVDVYQLDRMLRPTMCKIQAKTKALVLYPPSHEKSKVVEIEIDEEKGSKSCLSLAQLQEIGRTILAFEKKFGFPVDIEWAFAANDGQESLQLYLLQIRPITQSFPPLKTYIDTNLCESYPGYSSRMTASFVAQGYTKTFKEGLEFLGVSKARLQVLQVYLENLVARRGGHMYYDLTSYYTVLRSLPGGQANVERWHHMIGGTIDLGTGETAMISLTLSERVRSALALAKLFVFHTPIFNGLYRTMEQQRESLTAIFKSAQNSKDIACSLKKAFETTKGFGLTALNDFLIMILLKKMIHLLEENHIPATALPNLIKTSQGVESLAPLKDLERLVGRIPNRDRFFELCELKLSENKLPEWDFAAVYKDLFVYLKDQGYGDTVENIKSYLRLWGQRSFEELKLESLTLLQSPSLLVKLLKFTDVQPSLHHQSPLVLESYFASSSRSRWEILRFKVKMSVLQYFAHKAIQARERTRLIRGQYFSLVREMFLAMVKALDFEHPKLFRTLSLSDFFELPFETAIAYGEGQKSANDIHEYLLAQNHDPKRKENACDFPEIVCMEVQSDVLTFPLQDFSPFYGGANKDHHDGSARELQGLGASHGVIEGEALRLEKPEDAMRYGDLAKKILVTRTTDPGWVFIMAKCGGLISEKGSLLSHTAIIGREMGIPTVVGVADAFRMFPTGTPLRVDGTTGAISILDLSPNRHDKNAGNDDA